MGGLPVGHRFGDMEIDGFLGMAQGFLLISVFSTHTHGFSVYNGGFHSPAIPAGRSKNYLLMCTTLAGGNPLK
jgi:hypothetical protein